MNTGDKKIVFSGIRPTGPSHLGHLAGVFQNWISLQQQYSCFYSLVTWHALSSEYQDSRVIKDYTFEVAADLLSIGIDPERCVLFVQSDVAEHAELFLDLAMVIPLPWLQRVPTFKEQQKEIKDRDLNTFGFLGYPVLQTADIILYKASLVPVGEDQAYHLELAREITRRFNRFFGEIFPEPQMLLTEVPKLAGTDGRKMSKSYGNAVFLKDSPDVLRKKISPMKTDIRRKRKTDPGDPEDCPAFTLHRAFVSKERRKELEKGCRSAGIGCLECKNVVIDNLISFLTPFWEKREKYENEPDRVWQVLEDGRQRAQEIARKTMKEVRNAIGI